MIDQFELKIDSSTSSSGIVPNLFKLFFLIKLFLFLFNDSTVLLDISSAISFFSSAGYFYWFSGWRAFSSRFFIPGLFVLTGRGGFGVDFIEKF